MKGSSDVNSTSQICIFICLLNLVCGIIHHMRLIFYVFLYVCALVYLWVLYSLKWITNLIYFIVLSNKFDECITTVDASRKCFRLCKRNDFQLFWNHSIFSSLTTSRLCWVWIQINSKNNNIVNRSHEIIYSSKMKLWYVMHFRKNTIT